MSIAKSLHVKLADESVCIGPASAAESYLNIPVIISAAEITGANSIHPGYGFHFRKTRISPRCANRAASNLSTPRRRRSRSMGDKVEARKLVKSYGVPVLPGDGRARRSRRPQTFSRSPRSIGYPIIVKARAGGGGKGMRIVDRGIAI